MADENNEKEVVLIISSGKGDLGISELDVLRSLIGGKPLKADNKNFGKIPNLTEIISVNRPSDDPVTKRMKSIARKITALS